MTLAACIVLLTAVSVPAHAGDDRPLRPKDAHRIALDFNDQNDANNAVLDLAGQARVEADPVKAIDDFLFLSTLERGDPPEGAPRFRLRRVVVPTNADGVFLAVQDVTYPDAAPTTDLAVFVETTPGEWKLTMTTGTAGVRRLPTFAGDDDHGRLIDTRMTKGLRLRPESGVTASRRTVCRNPRRPPSVSGDAGGSTSPASPHRTTTCSSPDSGTTTPHRQLTAPAR